MSGKDVKAGGAYVEVFVKNEELDKGLSASNQKIRGSLSVAKSAIMTAGTGVGAAAIAGYSAIATIGKGVASAVSATAAKATNAVKGQKAGLDTTAKALQHLTPLSVRLWDATQGGVGRATRMLGSLREAMVATGSAGKPLLDAMDGLAKKGAGIAWKARASSLLHGDVVGAVGANHALKTGREMYLQDRMRGFGGNLARGVGGIAKGFTGEGGGWRGLASDFGGGLKHFGKAAGQLGSYANIKGGYAATAVASGGVKLAGKSLMALGNVTGVTKMAGALHGLSRSMTAVPFRPISSGMAAMNKSVSVVTGTLTKMRGVASSAFGAMKSAALGPIAMLAGGALVARNFTQGLADVGDRAAAAGRTVEQQSTMEAAAKLAGVSIDETVEDKNDSAEERAAKAAKRAKLQSKMGEASSSGATVTTEQARVAKEASTAMASVQNALSGALAKVMVSVSGFMTKNPKLMSQIFGIAKAMGVAAGVAAALSAGIGFIMSPMGALAIGAAAVGAAMTFFGEETKAVLGPIGECLATLQADFDQTFGGIMDALSAGNLGLAAEIAWAGLMLVFNRGWAFIHSGWLTFKDATLGVFDEMQTSLRVKLDEMFPGFELAWTETVGFLGDVWTSFCHFFLDAWDVSYQILAKGINYLRSLFSRAFDLKAANEAIDKQVDERIGQRGMDTEKELAQRKEARAKRAQDLAMYGTAAVLDAEKEERKKQREAESEEARKADAESLADKIANLKKLTDQAAAERKAQEVKTAAIVSKGATKAKKDVEATNKGAEALDIRTQGGMSLIAQTMRGHASKNPLVDLAGKNLAEVKKNNAWAERNWQRLVVIANNLPPPPKPIGG